MSAEPFLNRLSGVKSIGHLQWKACCPAHKDKTPSLHITEVNDGRVLLHCFGGCATDDVLAAVGMTWKDIMPPRVGGYKGQLSGADRCIPARTILDMVSTEITVIWLIATDFREKKKISDADWARLTMAINHIRAAMHAT